jgi:hypothetical protein
MRRLRWILILAMSLPALIPGSSRADGPFDWQQSAQLRDAQTLKRAGIGFVIAGLVVEAATIALWGATTTVNCNFDYGCASASEQDKSVALAMSAIATSALAPVLFGPGIAMWSVGAHREKVATRD